MNGLSEVLNFADVLHEYRTEAQLSQQEVADGINVERVTVIRWEHGKAVPNVANIRSVGAFLHIPKHIIRPFLESKCKKHQTVVPKNCSQEKSAKR